MEGIKNNFLFQKANVGFFMGPKNYFYFSFFFFLGFKLVLVWFFFFSKQGFLGRKTFPQLANNFKKLIREGYFPLPRGGGGLFPVLQFFKNEKDLNKS